MARTPVADQAFSVGRVLGLQFHPEVNEEVLQAWLATDGEAQLAQAGVDVPPLLAQTRQLTGAAAASNAAGISICLSSNGLTPSL